MASHGIKLNAQYDIVRTPSQVVQLYIDKYKRNNPNNLGNGSKLKISYELIILPTVEKILFLGQHSRGRTETTCTWFLNYG